MGQWIKLTIKSTEAVNEFLAPYQPKPEWTSILNNGIALQEKHSIAEIRGNRIRLNEPLHTHINHEHDWTIKYRRYLEEIGVEDISFHGMWFEKFVHFKNFIHNSGWGILSLTRCFNSWVRRVSFVNCNRALGVDQGGAVSIYHITDGRKSGPYRYCQQCQLRHVGWAFRRSRKPLAWTWIECQSNGNCVLAL